MWDNIRRSNTPVIGVPGGRRENEIKEEKKKNKEEGGGGGGRTRGGRGEAMTGNSSNFAID